MGNFMANKLPFRRDAAAMANQAGPAGAIGASAPQAQAAPSGSSPAAAMQEPRALPAGNALPVRGLKG